MNGNNTAPHKGSPLLRGFRTGIPISLGYFAVAFALGITARSAGMTALQAGAMSAGMLASAGEFAAVTLIASGAGVMEMITTTVVVNLRYFLMGASLSQKVDEKTPLIHRFLLSYCITDEIFGVCMAQEGYLVPVFVYGTTFISAVGWTTGTVLGVLMGNILPAMLVNALSVALYGMFLAVIIPASRKNRFIAGVVVVSMAASALFAYAPVLSGISAGFRVIILTLLIAGGAAFLRPVDPEAENTDGEAQTHPAQDGDISKSGTSKTAISKTAISNTDISKKDISKTDISKSGISRSADGGCTSQTADIMTDPEKSAGKEERRI